jgi:hypothetical protein
MDAKRAGRQMRPPAAASRARARVRCRARTRRPDVGRQMRAVARAIQKHQAGSSGGLPPGTRRQPLTGTWSARRARGTRRRRCTTAVHRGGGGPWWAGDAAPPTRAARGRTGGGGGGDRRCRAGPARACDLASGPAVSGSWAVTVGVVRWTSTGGHAHGARRDPRVACQCGRIAGQDASAIEHDPDP